MPDFTIEQPESYEQPQPQLIQTSPSNHKTLICFTPRNASGIVSLVKTSSITSSGKITIDDNQAVISVIAIIDKVEFFGINHKILHF